MVELLSRVLQRGAAGVDHSVVGNLPKVFGVGSIAIKGDSEPVFLHFVHGVVTQSVQSTCLALCGLGFHPQHQKYKNENPRCM